jgi:formylglycine-generating enzyme required for sulfatase activity/class 3 adenylate cyclase
MGEITRRLATIVMADIVGYSRLMNVDERGTHQRVQRLLHELIEPTIDEHRGRLVKQRGDGFLSMFDSPVEAVRCAIVIQQSMISRNLEWANDQAIKFRIGINLGDVIVEPDDVYGEGVNVAARLEQLAEPGNIFISGGVYEQVRYKLVCGYQSLGDRKVKNISDPIATYRVLPDPASVNNAVSRGRKMLIYGTLGSLCVGLVVAEIYFGQPSDQHVIAATNPPPLSAPPMPLAVKVPDPPKPPEVKPDIKEATVVPLRPVERPVDPPAIPIPVRPDPPPVPTPPEPPTFTEPEMLLIIGGMFQMGSTEDSSEQPVHRVAMHSFWLAKYPVTVQQWLECNRARACNYTPGGNAEAPVNNISWVDAQQYVTWLSQASQQTYRLPSESEWEYAARGGTDTRYWWGNMMKPGVANCRGCGDSIMPIKIGTRIANPFGLFDINSGVTEWTEDCWFKDYRGAPVDGSARIQPNCREHVVRGGAWNNDLNDVRTASRDYYDGSVRYPTHGLRVARSQ